MLGPRTTTMVGLNLILEIIVSKEHDKFMMIYMALAMPMVVSRVYMRRQDKEMFVMLVYFFMMIIIVIKTIIIFIIFMILAGAGHGFYHPPFGGTQSSGGQVWIISFLYSF